MTSQELRKKFLDFFEKNNHAIIPSASLIPSGEEQLEGKEKVLFTSAGMQPLIPYLLGKSHPEGKRLANVQKCLRTDDIDQVGDAVHHTFFEMLGNWSLGDYWKDEAIRLSFEFLTKELEIPIEKLAVSVFAGDKDTPRDEESAIIWKNLGIPEDRIFYFGKDHNWWPTGEKSGLCGPDTEMFYWISEGKPEGKPNEDPRWVEFWNDVFIQFNRKEDGTLEDLPQKNVDTGMGLERILAVLNGKESDYETDLFEPIIAEIRKSKNNYSKRSQRIIADHLKAAVFLLAAGVQPNSEDSRGSVVHRLITLALFQENKQLERKILDLIVGAVILGYQDEYTELAQRSSSIYQEMHNVGGALYQLVTGPVYNQMSEKLELDYKSSNSNANASGTISFYHQSMGIPEPVAFGAAQMIGLDIEKIKPFYNEELNKHKEASRVEKGKFKGGLADHSEIVTKYHTATHLLHQALREILGPQVIQKGSNITSERLRFDFSFERKMTDEEIKKVEDLVNEKIKEDLPVTKEVMDKEKALQSGALGFFNEKYGDKVTIYSIGDFSRELCGGPHVEHIGVIGKIKITKEEAISSGTRRIRAEIVLR
ncbi:MAG: alanine--tRNA ligase [Patescibacteria group bacterium]